MAETSRAYVPGDSVLSTSPLLSSPQDNGVRLEIPMGVRGTVVDVRPYEYPKPYAVQFEVGVGGLVEIDVTEAQIARVTPPAEPLPVQGVLPPVTVAEPVRSVRRHKLPHIPTMRHPHRVCRQAHPFHRVLWCGMYGAALYLLPWITLGATAVVIAGLYTVHLSQEHQWSWRPWVEEWEDEPLDGSELTLNAPLARLCPVADHALTVCLSVFLLYYISNSLTGSPGSAVTYVVLTATSFVAWLVRAVVHAGSSVFVLPEDD